MNRAMGRYRGGWQAACALALITCSGLGQAGELAGTLAWSERLAMGTLVSGVVKQVAVAPGQPVAKGDLLLALDDRGFRAELSGARAELQRAEVLLEEAQREDERATELYDRTVLSEHERTQATIALRQAEAAAQRAQAQLTGARIDLERSQLRAPFDGRVLAVEAAPGQSVVSTLQSEALLVLAADGQMLVQAQADLATAREIEQSASLAVEVAGQRLPAQGVRVGFEPVAQAAGGALYPVSVRFTRPAELLLRAGEAARLLW